MSYSIKILNAIYIVCVDGLKYIVIVSFLAISCAAYSQKFHNNTENPNGYVTVPIGDFTPHTLRVTNLWTGVKYPIATPPNLIKIWTDNGVVIENQGEWTDYIQYFIKPQKNGIVNIYTVHTINSENGRIDTLKGTSTFKAIPMPKLKTVINKKLLKESSEIEYDVVFTKDLKPIRGTRYQLCALPSATKVYSDEIEIGEISSLIKENEEVEKELLKKGNRIIFPKLVICDTKTDLMIYTDPIDYKYR